MVLQEGGGGTREYNSRRQGLNHHTCLLTLMVIEGNAVLVLLVVLTPFPLPVLLDDLEAAVH